MSEVKTMQLNDPAGWAGDIVVWKYVGGSIQVSNRGYFASLPDTGEWDDRKEIIRIVKPGSVESARVLQEYLQPIATTNDGYVIHGYVRSPVFKYYCFAIKGDDVIWLHDLVSKELAPYTVMEVVSCNNSDYTVAPTSLIIHIEIGGVKLRSPVLVGADVVPFTSQRLRELVKVDSLKSSMQYQGVEDVKKGLSIAYEYLKRSLKDLHLVESVLGLKTEPPFPKPINLIIECYTHYNGKRKAVSYPPLATHITTTQHEEEDNER